MEEVKKNDGYIGRKPRIKKIDFPIQKLDSFEYKSDKTITKFVEQLNEMIDTSVHTKISYKTFMPRILGTTINETYMGHDWVFSCLP